MNIEITRAEAQLIRGFLLISYSRMTHIQQVLADRIINKLEWCIQ